MYLGAYRTPETMRCWLLANRNPGARGVCRLRVYTMGVPVFSSLPFRKVYTIPMLVAIGYTVCWSAYANLTDRAMVTPRIT